MRGGKPKVYPAEMVAEVSRRYALNETQFEIAAALGTTQKVIWRLMTRHGIGARVAAKRNQWGAANHSWKGSGASYKAFHQRLVKRFGKPKHCEKCGTTDPSKSYDWANRSGKYDDINDYVRLCRSCHWVLDKKVENLRRGSEVANARA